MSMVLAAEHISVIGRVDYPGADKYEASGEAVLIHGQTTGQIAIALRFACNPFITSLLRHPDRQDPCDKEMLQHYVSKLIASACHYPFFGFLEDSIFPEAEILEGDNPWTFSYGYGTCDKSQYNRYLFGHPTDESVDTGQFGRKLMTNHKLDMFYEINASHSADEPLDIDE